MERVKHVKIITFLVQVGQWAHQHVSNDLKGLEVETVVVTVLLRCEVSLHAKSWIAFGKCHLAMDDVDFLIGL